MIDLFGKKVEHKSRKYPIKRNELGKSARQRSFAAFDRGKRPTEAARLAGISLRTACRYHADWKKQPTGFRTRYRLAKIAISDPRTRKELYQKLAKHLEITEAQMAEELSKPYGLRKLLLKWWWQPVVTIDRPLTPKEEMLVDALELIGMFKAAKLTSEEMKELINRFAEEVKRKHKAQGNASEADRAKPT